MKRKQERAGVMGRGRAPCCQKIGLHKGSWTPQEDIRLISYIRKHGHGNWRALPKQAGLLRCGKSCRLRWINYLRPDIKRGNFTKEEEDTIINLHELLGNKWSKIASCLPGRTDNEIKNVWNTHLKKRIKHQDYTTQSSMNNKSWSEVNPPSSSSSSGITFTEGEELSLEKIEIPIEPQLDIWDILDSSLSPNTSSLPPPPSPPPPAVENDDIFSDIPIDPDLWSDATNIDSNIKEADSSDGGKLADDSMKWLAYLEEELGLFDEAEDKERVELISMQEGDSMESYFHKRPSSSSSSLTKLVDLKCTNAYSLWTN